MNHCARHILAGCLVVSTTLACGSSDDDGTTAKQYVIAWVPKSTTNQLFSAGKDGAETKGAELGVTIRYQGTEAVDDAAQAAIVDQLVAAKVDGIIISVAGATAVPASLCKARDAGIKVITFDSDVPAANQDCRVTFFGFDDVRAGRLEGRVLMTAMMGTSFTAPEDGTTEEVTASPSKGIAVLAGSETAGNMVARLKGLDDEITAFNAAHATAFFRIPNGTFYCKDVEADAQTLIEQATTDLASQLGGWMMPGSWGIRPGPGATAWTQAHMPNFQAAAHAPNYVKTVSVNARPQELSSMYKVLADGQPGRLTQGLVGQKTYAWGFDTVQMMYDHLTKGATFNATLTPSGMDLVCLNSFKVQEQNWESGDFTTALPACGYPQLGDVSDLAGK